MTAFKADQFWEQRLTKVKGLEGVGYAKLGPAFNKWAYKVRRHVFLREWKKLFKENSPGRVLDIGSGTGFYIALWHQLQASTVSGADITDVAVANLKATFPGDAFYKLDIGGDVSAFASSQGTFDAISCMDVLFHIVDDTRFVQAIKNISLLLKPGGYFVYSDNFVRGKTVRTRHQVSHSNEDLLQWLSDAGFEVVTRKPFMELTNYPINTNNAYLRMRWFVLENVLALFKPLGHVLGPPLYLADTFFTNRNGYGISSHFLILRKRE